MANRQHVWSNFVVKLLIKVWSGSHRKYNSLWRIELNLSEDKSWSGVNGPTNMTTVLLEYRPVIIFHLVDVEDTMSCHNSTERNLLVEVNFWEL